MRRLTRRRQKEQAEVETHSVLLSGHMRHFHSVSRPFHVLHSLHLRLEVAVTSNSIAEMTDYLNRHHSITVLDYMPYPLTMVQAVVTFGVFLRCLDLPKNENDCAKTSMFHLDV